MTDRDDAADDPPATDTKRDPVGEAIMAFFVLVFIGWPVAAWAMMAIADAVERHLVVKIPV
jgi:hypothetical protein